MDFLLPINRSDADIATHLRWERNSMSTRAVSPAQSISCHFIVLIRCGWALLTLLTMMDPCDGLTAVYLRYS
jgi:hypothetical protein